MALYQEARYREAYDLISRENSSPDAIPSLVYYLRYSFASRAGMHDLALDLLREAVEGKGYWYSSDHLGDDDLEPLRARPEFGKLVELCKGREEKEHREARSEMGLIQPRTSGKRKPALVIAMHGNQLNMHTTQLNWCGNALSDCVVALPQSSHSVCTDAYSWVDPVVGSAEVRAHLEAICQMNITDQGGLILGGFSAGARVAVHMLKDRVKARGVILVSPWLPDLEALEPAIAGLGSDEVKVYLICGDRDRDCFESTNLLADLLRSNDVPFRYRIVKGMGHCYPQDFDQELAEARSFFR